MASIWPWPRPGSGSWPTFRSRIRSRPSGGCAGAIRLERTTKAQAEEDAQKGFVAGANHVVKVGMRDAFRQVCQERKRALADGEDPDAAAHALATKLFSDLPEDRRDRRKCRVCRDRGSVECWDRGAMADARLSIVHDVPAHPELWRTSWVQCSCEAGKAQWTERLGKSVVKTDLPRFDPVKWVLVSEGQEALLEWAANWRAANYQDFGAYSGN